MRGGPRFPGSVQPLLHTPVVAERPLAATHLDGFR